MEQYHLHTPDGVQDYLPVECYHKRQLEAEVRRTFRAWGYREIEPGIMEYLDVFTNAVSAFPQEAMVKFCDAQGRLLVLRPDITTPTARLAATRLREESLLRLCYLGNSFHFAAEALAAGQREFTQMGVELMGLEGPEADAEVIALAISAFQQIGLEGFQIDIGQVEFFKGLAEEAGLKAEEIEELRRLVEQKNLLGMEMFMGKAQIAPEVRNRILELPTLYGGREVLDVARAYSDNARCREAVAYIDEVLGILADYGLEEFVSVDLGMLQSLDYYTGMIFRGICEDMGHPILTGGRYDKLVAQFGRVMPATGFAMGVKPLLIALERQGALGRYHGPDAVVGYAPACRAQAIALMQQLRKSGRTVEPYTGSRDALAGYARASHAGCSLYVGPDGVQQLEGEEDET